LGSAEVAKLKGVSLERVDSGDQGIIPQAGLRYSSIKNTYQSKKSVVEAGLAMAGF